MIGVESLPVLFAVRFAVWPSAPSAGTTDEMLVSRALRGDRESFDELYRRHVDQVWRRLTHLLGADPEREDLTQQIFLEVFRALPKFRGDARFRTFLYRVVINTALNHMGSRRRRTQPLPDEMSDALIAPEASPEARAEQRERLAFIWSLLDRIKPKKRVAFVLRCVDGLSLEEIGEIVQASVPTVAQRVRHAHQELQTMMDRREERP